jgi:phosphopantetheinyl transferase
MMKAWVRDLNLEIDENSQGPNDDYDSWFEDVYFVAVGCGYKTLEPIIKDIPELYLSNDNCNTQVLMCGKREAVNEMCERLNKNQIFNQELLYKSGYHTPFIEKHLHILDYCLNQIEELKEPTIPIWSATSLEQYPTEMSEYRKLTIKHLTSPVRFRELISKLYTEEKARVFIQLGAGPLNGFVDDILRDEKYSTISTYNSGRSGIEQLRRVLALLFIEGKEVDTLFIRNGDVAKVIGQELELDFAPIVTEFPLIKEVLKKQSKLDFSSYGESDNSNQPLAQKVNENIREISLAQKEMLDIMNEVKSLEQKFNITSGISQAKEKKSQPMQVKTISTAKKPFKEEITITTRDYPYITDHTVVKQPDYWTVIEDFDVVIPMTMSIEMIMEIAEKHASNKKVVGLSSFSIFQWMNIFHEFKLKTEGSWISDDLMKLEMKNFITTEIMLGDEYPTPPQKYTGEIDLGKKTHEPPTRHFIYSELMFHGPNYQGIEKVTDINERGMKAVVKAAGGKASLLDTLGQLIGIFLRTTIKENNVCFPVSVGKITFYQDFHDQNGIFDFTLVVTEINDDFINGDMILKRNGKIWCIAENWLNRRFEMDNALWNSINIPLDSGLAKQLEGTPVMYFDLAYSKTGSWPFIEKRYLNREEKAHLKGLLLNKRRPYTISRIAIKDAIRTYIIEKHGKKSYPIEITINHNEKGKPFAKGLDELRGLEISLSHKGNESVALVSEKPVGIDIEKIEERSPDFMDMSFTEGELALLKDREQSEWSTRFWTAKEAYGKMLGVGLEGNPKKYEIDRIEGDSLFIGQQEIHTVKHKEKYIVAWTQKL